MPNFITKFLYGKIVMFFVVSSSSLPLNAMLLNLAIDNNNDGITDKNMTPTSELNGDATLDFIAPITNTQIEGTAGLDNWYRSEVTVT